MKPHLVMSRMQILKQKIIIKMVMILNMPRILIHVSNAINISEKPQCCIGIYDTKATFCDVTDMEILMKIVKI